MDNLGLFQRSYQDFSCCPQLLDIGSNHQVPSKHLNNARIFGSHKARDLVRRSVEEIVRRRGGLASGPEIMKQEFSGNIHYRHHTSMGVDIEATQPYHKRRNVDDPDLSDDYSLWVIVNEGKSKAKRQQLATVKSERSSSIQSSEKDIRMDNGVSDHQNMGYVDASFRYEDSCLADKQQMGCCYANKALSDSKYESYDGLSNLTEEPSIVQDEKKIKTMSMAKDGRIDANCFSPESTTSNLSEVELKKNEVAISLVDFFTAEQIKEHLCNLKQRNNLIVGEESIENTSRHDFGENTCQLCEMDEIKLAPPSMFCESCEARIKCNSIYYWTVDELGTRQCFCTHCFRGSRSNILVKGLSISKEKLHKDKNTEEEDEAWVGCDNCGRWQHQICALYNSKQDFDGKVKYICPYCRLAEMKAMEHVSTPIAVGAQDLPRTLLSDHIEQRLFRSLEHERKQRAESLGKSPEEVPGASDLTVRVVLSVNKQVKVGPKFLDILHDGKYPTEFPYKSKVILLFQKVEGVDVCLFCMYVQEFGSECEQPNQRSVYISYLDSVKYFRPEVKTVAGEALRTFVYHEIMIGYLSYCKRRGFTTCYIWACPPSKGDDYIFYYHPVAQKLSKNLRAWYKKFLQRAEEENVVVEYTNIYDCFFIPRGKDNHNITAARLPYFLGDYWSGAAEDIIRNTEKDSEDKSESKVNRKTQKRSLRATRHSDSSVEETMDVQVMQQLGDAILPYKEDFFVVRLQFTCVNCREAILSGNHWTCNQCHYHLCSRCHAVMENPAKETVTKSCCPEKHLLLQIAVDVPENTDDKDIILDNELFESRHSFLSFCQKNHYQFDTLRRSKHSSMMILYHIQKMTELTIGTVCSICQQHKTVERHCEICSEFLVCTACYQREGNGCHVHELIQHSTKVDLRTTSKQMQDQGLKIKSLLDLLLHAALCPSSREKSCPYPKCQAIKTLFQHGRGCAEHVAGGCKQCKKIWHLICLHARNCEDSSCKFPRCMDVKKYKEKIGADSELQRRAAAKGSLCKNIL
ncbi:histone acetyltransferase HAC1-like [Henckelia pumila]|uniref:histone acetyltransferase HAC1-like n=1 Tax=Henckelia pumila TaxID=405737 RepID=UPI003C6E83F9